MTLNENGKVANPSVSVRPVFLSKKQREELKIQEEKEREAAKEALLAKEKSLLLKRDGEKSASSSVASKETKRAGAEVESTGSVLKEAEIQAIKVKFHAI